MRALMATLAAATMLMGPHAGAQDQDAAGSDTLRELIYDQQATAPPLEEPQEDPEVLLTAEELDELVAPVALYPDALLAQVLVAATYPLQLVKADRLIEASTEMSEDELRDELAGQEFDPSVLVLMSGFPTVVERMADDIEWTEQLGDAMLRQDEDVLAAVQRMRTQAEATGYLTSNAAQIVEEDEGDIYIRPADPEVVYVPQYDAAAFAPMPRTYGYVPQPRAAFAPMPHSYGYLPQPRTGFAPDPLVAGAVAFGAALLVGELFDDDDDDKGNGWDDYWRRQRAIDWRDRELYPRPVFRSDRDHAWSRERDRYWDRRERRWRRNQAEDRKRSRDAADWAALLDGQDVRVRRDLLTPEEIRVRRQRDERTQQDRERRAAIDRREAQERREDQAKAAARQEKKLEKETRAAARKQEVKAADRAEKQAKAAAEQQKQARAAARAQQARAAERSEQQAKAAAEQEKKAKAAARQERARAVEKAEKQAKAVAEQEKKAKAAAREERARAAKKAEKQAKAAAEQQKQARAAAREQAEAAESAAKQAAKQEEKQAKKAAKRACRGKQKDCQNE